MYELICQKPAIFLSAQIAGMSNFSQMFTIVGMYNFAALLNWYIRCSHSREAKLSGIFMKVHTVHCIQSYDTAGSLFFNVLLLHGLAKFKESID